MDDSRDRGVDRLMAQIKPRWSRERHERVFAAILDRIRRDDGRGRPAATGSSLRLSHAMR